MRLSREDYESAFRAYADALEFHGFAVTDVKQDVRGLYTWTAGDAVSLGQRELLEQLYRDYFASNESRYAKQLLCD